MLLDCKLVIGVLAGKGRCIGFTVTLTFDILTSKSTATHGEAKCALPIDGCRQRPSSFHSD